VAQHCSQQWRKREKQESTDDLESVNRWTQCAADEAERLVRLLLEVLGEVGGLLDPDPQHGKEKSERESTNDLESVNRWTECAADEAERLVRLLLEVLGEVGGLLDPPEHLHRPVSQKVNLKVTFFRMSHKEFKEIVYFFTRYLLNLKIIFSLMVPQE
jgi:hypothetical protein